MNDTPQREIDQKCDFVIVSAVKKFVHSKDRRCSPEFLKALDATVRTTIVKACEAHNGGAKTLDEGLLSAGTTGKIEVTGLRAVFDEVAVLGLQMNVQTKEEFQKRISKIKSLLEPFLAK
jgi:hypothetical protein